MKKHQHDIKTLHSLDSFGIRKVTLSNIRIEKLEDRIKPAVPFPHRHDFYQIMLVTQGKGTHRIDFVDHKIKPHQVFIMKPGQMHSWQMNQGIRGLIVEFNTDSLNSFKENERIMNDLSFSPDVHTFNDQESYKELVSLIQIMLTEFRRNLSLQDICLQGYLTAFLIQLIRSYQSQLRLPKTLTINERFRTLVEKYFREEHSVEFYAKQMNTSAQALTMQITRAGSKPPRQVIQERILLEAKRYLSFSDLSVAEIGYELGFDDANYFTRFFKVHEKLTPAAFRTASHFT